MAGIIPVRQTRRFRLKILACLLKPGWLARYGPIIKPEYFEQEDEHDVCTAMLEYHRAYLMPPDDPADILALLDGRHQTLIQSIYIGYDEWNLNLASDVLVQFAKEQAAKLAVLESIRDIENGELGSMMERLGKAMRVGEDIGETWLDIKDINRWMSQINIQKVPTGILHLDIAMGGGLGNGELGVFVAPPNYGKSMALINVGLGAAGPIHRGHVAHFTCEMKASIVAKRYAARCVFAFPKNGGIDEEEYKEQFEYANKLLMPGTIHAYNFNGTVSGLERELNVLIEEEGYKPDLIIVDYGDLLVAENKRNDRYMELGDIFTDLRELASPRKFDCPLWTATQANRGALGKEVITMGDLAESFRKAAIADALVAICQTAEEESASQCRLFLAKLRDGESRAMIAAKFYKRSQAIISSGFVTAGAR